MLTTTKDEPIDRGAFVRQRLASFFAVVPLSVWVVIHIWNNLAAFRGAEAWESATTQYAHPVAQLVTALVVLLPLALHTVWGLARLTTSRPNNIRYTAFANWKYFLQRLSAIGVALFIGAHLWLAMLKPRLMQGHAEPFSDVAHQMRTHMPTLLVYVLGTLGVAYHLANGLSSFAMGWGIVTSRAALRKLDIITIVFFVVLLAMSWAVIYALYRSGAP